LRHFSANGIPRSMPCNFVSLHSLTIAIFIECVCTCSHSYETRNKVSSDVQRRVISVRVSSERCLSAWGVLIFVVVKFQYSSFIFCITPLNVHGLFCITPLNVHGLFCITPLNVHGLFCITPLNVHGFCGGDFDQILF
jgi:hypothetical protein